MKIVLDLWCEMKWVFLYFFVWLYFQLYLSLFPFLYRLLTRSKYFVLLQLNCFLLIKGWADKQVFWKVMLPQTKTWNDET